MLRLLGATALLVFLSAPAAHAMSGDTEAIGYARRMIDVMGGRDAWSKARWIYAREDAWFAARKGPADAQFWRRVDEPAERARVDGPDWSREWSWTTDSGYRIRNGERTTMSEADLQQVLGWWRGEIYIMYVRFAREDEHLRLIKTEDRAFRVLDSRDGRNLGEFFVDDSGALYKWRFGYGDGEVEYLYGPLKSFGAIKAPTWGSLSDGSFRFFYTDFRLNERNDDIVFAKPRH